MRLRQRETRLLKTLPGHYKELKMAEKKNWIAGAIKKPGALRKELHVKEGRKIPEKKLERAAKKPGKEGKRARLAETLKKLRK